MKKQKEEPLHRRVPAELVRIWDEKNLQGSKHNTFEEVYVEWCRLSRKFLLMRILCVSVIGITSGLMIGCLVFIADLIITNDPNTPFPLGKLCGAFVLIIVIGFFPWYGNLTKVLSDLSIIVGRYTNLYIKDFNLRMETLMVLRGDSFKPVEVREHLYVLAYDLVVAERPFNDSGSDVNLEDVELAQKKLGWAREAFEPYYATVQYFGEYFNPPDRRRIFKLVEEQIEKGNNNF